VERVAFSRLAFSWASEMCAADDIVLLLTQGISTTPGEETFLLQAKMLNSGEIEFVTGFLADTATPSLTSRIGKQ
jgi:hypothetical protein